MIRVPNHILRKNFLQLLIFQLKDEIRILLNFTEMTQHRGRKKGALGSSETSLKMVAHQLFKIFFFKVQSFVLQQSIGISMGSNLDIIIKEKSFV